jgi:hypothetical protein
MRAINEDEAYSHLSPYLGKLLSAVKDSVNDYFSGARYSQTRHEHSLRSAASICHDKIKQAIIVAFESVPGAQLKTYRGLFMLSINGIVVLRFKKFNLKKLSAGIETQQLLAFNNQNPDQLELPDMPPNGLLHVGYQVNKLETGIESVYISCRHGKSNLWAWDITTEGMEVTEHVLVPMPETATPSRRKITAKIANSDGGEVNANI